MSELSFEKALDDLEKIVSKMEAGDLTLDESLKQYEKGVKLIRACNKKLDSCEQRIEMIIKNEDGDFEKTDFAEAETTEAKKPTKKKAVKKETKEVDETTSGEDKEEGMLF